MGGTHPERLPSEQREFDLLVDEVTDLRPLPAVAVRLISMVEDSRFSAQDLSATIRSDQALTAKILRLANSPSIGSPYRIRTLRDAVVLLGFGEVRAMAVTACVMDTSGVSNGQDPRSLLDYTRFWTNSLCVAQFSQILAKAEGLDADEAFTGGILHNVGRLIVAQHRPDWLRESVLGSRAGNVSVHDFQIARFGFTDAEIGAAIAAEWSFPEPLCEAVLHHAWLPTDFPSRSGLAYSVMRGRRFARAHGASDGIDTPASRVTPDLDWQQPRVVDRLRASGGVKAIMGRARGFLEDGLAA